MFQAFVAFKGGFTILQDGVRLLANRLTEKQKRSRFRTGKVSCTVQAASSVIRSYTCHGATRTDDVQAEAKS